MSTETCKTTNPVKAIILHFVKENAYGCHPLEIIGILHKEK